MFDDKKYKRLSKLIEIKKSSYDIIQICNFKNGKCISLCGDISFKENNPVIIEVAKLFQLNVINIVDLFHLFIDHLSIKYNYISEAHQSDEEPLNKIIMRVSKNHTACYICKKIFEDKVAIVGRQYIKTQENRLENIVRIERGERILVSNKYEYYDTLFCSKACLDKQKETEQTTSDINR